MEFFDQQWLSYRGIVDHNLMEHRQATDATAAELERWLAARPAGAPAPRMLDLGCGDLALLAPVLRRLPLGSYTGLDQAAVVLPLARRALGDVPYPNHWIEADLLAWARGTVGSSCDAVDILHSSFAIHHLDQEQKTGFLEKARQRLSPEGLFLWVDVFRRSGESREGYVNRYRQRIESGWHDLTPLQRTHVIDHLSRFDIPADPEAIQASAEAAGWHWRWGWRGQHDAEALAVLTLR